MLSEALVCLYSQGPDGENGKDGADGAPGLEGADVSLTKPKTKLMLA